MPLAARARTGGSVRGASSIGTAVGKDRVGDLISYQNSGKGRTTIADEVERA